MRRKLNCCRAKLFLVFGIFTFDILRAQNIIDGNSEVDSSALAANPAKLTETDFSEFIWQFAAGEPGADQPEARRILARLEAQVVKLSEGFPWMPFHHTLGISGYAAYSSRAIATSRTHLRLAARQEIDLLRRLRLFSAREPSGGP